MTLAPRRTVRTVRRLLALAAVAALGGTLAATPAAAATTAELCGRAHVAEIGWQGWQCVRQGQQIQLGTTGRGLAMEAVQLRAYGAPTLLCAKTHVQDIGPMPTQCVQSGGATLQVGTVGQGRRMEEFSIGTSQNDGWGVSGSGHVQDIGWQNWKAETSGSFMIVGTKGRALRLEAVKLRVFSN